eukprot:gene9221-biopygen12198
MIRKFPGGVLRFARTFRGLLGASGSRGGGVRKGTPQWRPNSRWDPRSCREKVLTLGIRPLGVSLGVEGRSYTRGGRAPSPGRRRSDVSVSSNSIVWDASGTRPRPFLPTVEGGAAKAHGEWIMPIRTSYAFARQKTAVNKSDTFSKKETPVRHNCRSRAGESPPSNPSPHSAEFPIPDEGHVPPPPPLRAQQAARDTHHVICASRACKDGVPHVGGDDRVPATHPSGPATGSIIFCLASRRGDAPGRRRSLRTMST